MTVNQPMNIDQNAKPSIPRPGAFKIVKSAKVRSGFVRLKNFNLCLMPV